ncbi:putative lipase atg15 [Dinochytrium kinnereticum]|nr:putative lipase atg15 [Dinochytrium kinnereticum]
MKPLLSLALLLLATTAHATIPQRPPRPHIISPPPPKQVSDGRTSRFRLAQVFHHGVIKEDPARKPRSGPCGSESEFDGMDRVPHSRGFFRVLDVDGIREKRRKEGGSLVLGGIEDERFDVAHYAGQVPVWSEGSPVKRQRDWEEAVKGFEEDVFVDQTLRRGHGGVEEVVKRFEEPIKISHKDLRLPNMTDTLTVLNLAKMTFNSYTEPNNKDWMDIPPWNVVSIVLTDRFGWESDGIRGYVFVDETKDTVVIAVKGTSLQTPIGGGPTSPRDKYNDNMMFSCCCAKAGWSWTPICDCARNTECSMDCIHRKSQFADSWTIFVAVHAWYPQSTSIWVVGHSLGGALASLLALTHDLPGVSYEAPGDFQYASRIGLIPDLPPGNDGDPNNPPNYDGFLNTLQIYHVGNNRDPIYLGECQGASSSCWYVGYALESKCHSGKECVYNQEEHDRNPPPTPTPATQDLASAQERLDVRYHSIETVIHTYLETWEYVPKCEVKPAFKKYT